MALGSGDEEADSGEGSEETDSAWFIRIEAKSFKCQSFEGVFVLKEIFKRGEREITLSLNQFTWICEVLQEKCKLVGSRRRKMTRRLDGEVISLIEGSNAKGEFLAIQVRNNLSDLKFLILPAGKQGRQWWRFAVWIKDNLYPEGFYSNRESTPVRVSASLATSSSSNVRSFREVLCSNLSRNKDCGCLKTLEEHVSELKSNLNLVMEELVRLRATIVAAGIGEYESHSSLNMDLSSDGMKESMIATSTDLSVELSRPLEVFSQPRISLSFEELTGAPVSIIPNHSLELAPELHGRDDQKADEVCEASVSASNFENSDSVLGNSTPLVEVVCPTPKDSGDRNNNHNFEALSVSKEESTGGHFGEDEGSDKFEFQNSNPSINGKDGSHKEDDSGVVNCHSLVRDHYVDTSWGSDKFFDVGPVRIFNLKVMLKEVESTMDFDNLPHGKGRCILIEGEYFDGATIFERLKPPARARVSKVAFKLWRRHVGRPLLKKLRHYGVNVSLDLYDKAPT